MKAFETIASGKWILAGEHAVLRGSPALVFPLKTKNLKFSFQPSSESLSLKTTGPHGAEFEVLFWGVFEKACQKVGLLRENFHGKVVIDSSIPIGAGLGASAALCVAIGRWFHFMGAVEEIDLYEFCRELENLFHGESSGVDVAVVLSNEPLLFYRNGKRETFQPQWSPKLFISYSGQRGMTAECVNKVKSILEMRPEYGRDIDQDMQKAVELALQALLLDEESGKSLLVGAIELAQSCFVRWGLTNELIDQKINDLRQHGASAVKMTGSGGGGYILSYCENLSSNKPDMIYCF